MYVRISIFLSGPDLRAIRIMSEYTSRIIGLGAPPKEQLSSFELSRIQSKKELPAQIEEINCTIEVKSIRDSQLVQEL